MRIILTGASGLIGSRFEELMFERHEIIPLTSQVADVTDMDMVMDFFEKHPADVVVHLAGKTDVDGCEKDMSEDLSALGEINGKSVFDLDTGDRWKGIKSAFAINVVGTKNIYDAACKKGIKFVYISSDFIFEGNGEYSEGSEAHPINWYGMTKWYGEQVVDVATNLIVRLSFPYGYPSSVKKDFFWTIASILKDKEEVSLIEDQTITPTFIDDIIFGVEFLLLKEAVGRYHLSGSSYENPYQMGQKIKELFGYGAKINPTTRDQIYAGRSARPFQSIMKNDKIVLLGYTPKTFDEGIELLKNN